MRRTYEVGQTAYMVAGKWDSRRAMSGEVTKVTASGQVTVSVKCANGFRQYRFHKHGYEWGNQYYGWSLTDEADYNKVISV